MFVDPAWNLALRLTDCDASAWDAVQEAFVQAFRQIRQLRDGTAFGFWLRRIVVNQAMNGHRLRGRESGEMPADNSGESPDPAWLDLEQALEALDPHDRMVLWLHDAEGMTHEEIASLADRTVSWSKTRLSRTRARMRRKLDRETEPTPRLIRL